MIHVVRSIKNFYFRNMSVHDIIWPKVVLFGDSLTQRSFEPRNGLWGALLADRLQRICDVIGRGFSGYTSRTCNIILPRLFSAENISDIEAFVICLGANDSSDKDSDTKQHVPIHEYSKNLEDIVNYLQILSAFSPFNILLAFGPIFAIAVPVIEELKEHGIFVVHPALNPEEWGDCMLIGLCKKKIVLMTPPPYYHEKYAAYCAEVGRSLPLRDNRTVSEYAEACFKVGQKCEVDVVNLYQEMIKDENWPRYLIDGLHFSHAGSVLVYALLWPHIAKRVQANKMILPPWNEIDLLHPEKDLKKH